MATISVGLGGRSGAGGFASSGGAVSTGGIRSTSTVCTTEPCPVTLASGRENIWPGIAVDDDSVYWTEHDGSAPRLPFGGDGRVMKVSTTGGATVVLAEHQDFPSYVRVDATSVYWTLWNLGNRGEMAMWSYASVMRAPLDGSKTSVVANVDLDYEFRVYGDIATDDANLYWAYQGCLDNDYADGSILRVSLADGSTTTLATDQVRPWKIAVNGSSVYWVNAGSAAHPGDSALMKMPAAGGMVTTLDVRASAHRAIALGPGHVYWTSADGAVMRLPLEGGAATTLADGQAGPVDIAVDAASVYWGNRDEGAIKKVPLGGGTPTTLVSGQPGIEALAVDATSVYWTTSGTPENDYEDGAVLKLTPK